MDTYYLSENLYIKDDKMYNKKNAELSWDRTLAFFAEKLV